MTFSKLKERIDLAEARLVVIGLGYVGLPVACLFADAGFAVTGIDVDAAKVEQINQGRCPIEADEPGLPELIHRVVTDGKLRATTDYAASAQADIVLIAVETPVDPATKKPRYHALRSALTALGPHLSPDTLVIIESTLAPGTMDRVVRPILESESGLRAGSSEDDFQPSTFNLQPSFHLVHCPERVMPGRLLYNLQHMHRVVGGSTPQAADLAVTFYRHIVQADLDPVDCLTAELVKTMENAYRDVQIAFANEMALLCEDLGADVWSVRELVNKSPGRHMLYPGAGVGGHCIPKDPWLLIANASEAFQPRLIRTARAVNDGMPHHVVALTVQALEEAGVDVAAARVAVLGYAYLENSDDTRNSPSVVVADRLRELGAKVMIHDPYVASYQGDLRKLLSGCDALITMVKHDVYRKLRLEEVWALLRRPIVVDGRDIFSREQPGDIEGIRRSVGRRSPASAGAADSSDR